MLRASRVSKSRSPYSRTTTTNSAARAKKRSVPEATLPRPHDVAIVDQAPIVTDQAPIVTQSQTVSTVASLVPLQPASSAEVNQDSIWIIGSSIIHWAHIYAKNSNQENLGQESSNILWHGIRGMVWEQLYPTIEFLLARNKKPKIIIIHCGGNNIGQAHNTLRGLQKYYKSTLANIANLLPQTFIIWSHILPRNNWINCLANTEGQNCRRRINSACATFVLNKFQGRGASVSYPDIRAQCKELFRKDGVHLSDLGNSIFINILRNALDHFIGCNFVSSTFP
ncbi:uncharacterized protein LOC134269616 [Saccostrea cucullata]|uniref:uncharacterized protein LOC134269616 n=1 Tax=Saccostrea cuccullata TaxID=36930 RepID=UPI002ED16F27